MPGPQDTPLIPLRMLNEFTYCRRLGILEWVDGEWEESSDTVAGGLRHAAVDRPGFRLRRRSAEGDPEGGAMLERLQMRSVELSDSQLGITAKIDLVELEAGKVEPVDYKKAKRPHTPTGVWDPERVQICAQGLLLRAAGYSCDAGAIYFAGSNDRVRIEFDADLVALTLRTIRELREAASAGALPPPLVDSPKCPRCSLVSICLPDETAWLTQHASPPRRLIPAEVDRFPVYVQEPGARVRKSGGLLQIYLQEEKLGEARLEEISQLVLFGQVQVTTPAIHELCRREIPVVYLSSGGWLHGVTSGLPHKNIELRRKQFAAAADPEASLRIAKHLVRAKLLNMRTLLRRNAPDVERETLGRLRQLARAGLRAPDLNSLLGYEGAGTRVYFENLPQMLKGDPDFLRGFSFDGRTRRPPRDRINSLLSFAYSMLAREFTQVATAVGLDPYLGYLHAPRYGRPALALDLMEPFRPLVADSTCLGAINNAEIAPTDFVERFGAVNLTREGRAKFLGAFERRLAQEVTHPVFGYRVSYRRIFEIEVRLLGRYLCGELPSYVPLQTR